MKIKDSLILSLCYVIFVSGMETRLDPEWLKDFEAASRRSLKERLRYAFIHTYKPVLDDEPFRSFDTMEEYRKWCELKLPSWLGYGKTI